MYKKYNNYINLIYLKAYAIMVIAKKDIVPLFCCQKGGLYPGEKLETR